MPETREVHIHNAHPRLRLDARARGALRRAVALLDAGARGGKFSGGCPAGALSLAFLTDAALAALHAQFLGDPSATDVITFEGAGGAASGGGSRFTVHGSQSGAAAPVAEAGEICVSVDAARAYAKEHGRVFAEEMMLYVVHGWLHLAGYDDLQPEKKRRMRAAEKRAMALLREGGALPGFAPALAREAATFAGG